MQKLTYKKAGVDIRAATLFKVKLGKIVSSSQSASVLKGVGGFGSLFSLASGRLHDPVLVSSADGVGTKLKIAMLCAKHDTVGIDCVAMNVNDILCVGARTLFFLDYIAYSNVKEPVLLDLVKGLNSGCLQAGCSLIGGETAQMPDMYAPGDYDLAGFCVGVVERKSIIDGSKIKAGNVVIGLESNGIHSNGYSLVRKVFSPAEQKRMAKELLKPTRIYVLPVLRILEEFNGQRTKAVTGISHITGGSFYDKIARILPKDVDAVINESAWNVPGIFRLIQARGGVAKEEMYHTLNMGIGMVLIVERGYAQPVLRALAAEKIKSWVIGETVKGSRKVRIV
jgi:phosphoribosylformylglycinamidine cyclo-ligase